MLKNQTNDRQLAKDEELILKEIIIRGQEWVNEEEKIARQIIMASIEGLEDKVGRLKSDFINTSVTARTIEGLLYEKGYIHYDIEKIQEEMDKKGECKGTEFSYRMRLNEKHYSDDEDTRIYAHLYGEYVLILYQLTIDIIRNENLSESQVSTLVDNIVKLVINDSFATRCLFCKHYELARELSTPELMADKNEVLKQMERFTLEYGDMINKDIETSTAYEDKLPKELIERALIREKVQLAALNIQRMSYGLLPVEAYRTDKDYITDIFDWSKEKAKEYSGVKQKALSK